MKADLNPAKEILRQFLCELEKVEKLLDGIKGQFTAEKKEKRLVRSTLAHHVKWFLSIW